MVVRWSWSSIAAARTATGDTNQPSAPATPIVVSVTSGASVPEALVEGVLSYLTERGYPDAQAVHSAEESLIFALPPELRRDLRAAAKA